MNKKRYTALEKCMEMDRVYSPASTCVPHPPHTIGHDMCQDMITSLQQAAHAIKVHSLNSKQRDNLGDARWDGRVPADILYSRCGDGLILQ